MIAVAVNSATAKAARLQDHAGDGLASDRDLTSLGLDGPPSLRIRTGTAPDERVRRLLDEDAPSNEAR